MRKIKFRGYSKELKKWVFGDLIQDSEDVFFIAKEKTIGRVGGGAYNIHSGIGWDDDNYYDISIVEKSSIGQYVGLKDENGKEVYEGDIIKSQFLRKNGIIKYANDKVCFMAKISTNEWHFISDLYDLEIIGNIYENSELLKESKCQ